MSPRADCPESTHPIRTRRTIYAASDSSEFAFLCASCTNSPPQGRVKSLKGYLWRPAVPAVCKNRYSSFKIVSPDELDERDAKHPKRLTNRAFFRILPLSRGCPVLAEINLISPNNSSGSLSIQLSTICTREVKTHPFRRARDNLPMQKYTPF